MPNRDSWGCAILNSYRKMSVREGGPKHGREAVEQAPGLQPDLIVLDLSMPMMDGLDAALLLLKIPPNVWLILFTAHDGPELRTSHVQLEYMVLCQRAMR
jgi:CheY-like chemotaxis protein